METELRLVVGVQTDVEVLCWTLNGLKLLLLEGYRSLPSLSPVVGCLLLTGSFSERSDVDI